MTAAHALRGGAAQAGPARSTAPAGPARIGPNAVLQVAAALRALEGEAAARRAFAACGLQTMLARPPAAMIDQRAAAALHRAVRETLPADRARAVAREAGRRTADYLIANRIPKAVATALRLCPPRIAVPLLIRAIGRNAWTFVGSGRMRARLGRPALIEIEDNPLAAAPCEWHAATFERLFQRLAAPGAAVRETACCGAGAPACRFEIRY